MQRIILAITILVLILPSTVSAQWARVGGQANDLEATDQILWIISKTDKSVQYWAQNGWQRHGGSVKADFIAAGPDNLPSVIGSDYKIYKSTGNPNWVWREYPGNGRGDKTIGIDGSNVPWIRSRWNFYYHDGSKWVSDKNYGQVIEANNRGVKAAIGNGYSSYRIIGTEWKNLGDLRCVDIDIDDGANIWVVGQDKQVYRHDGRQWMRFPGVNATRISVTPSGTPYVIDTKNEIYVYQSSQAQPQPQPQPGINLGSVWYEAESGWQGVWTRRENSNVFDAVWTHRNSRITAVLTIELKDNVVYVYRRQSSDGNDCNYAGVLSADGRQISGNYACTIYKGPFPWSATIY